MRLLLLQSCFLVQSGFNPPLTVYFLNCEDAFSKAFFIDANAASTPVCLCCTADSLAARISCNFLFAASRLARIALSCSSNLGTCLRAHFVASGSQLVDFNIPFPNLRFHHSEVFVFLAHVGTPSSGHKQLMQITRATGSSKDQPSLARRQSRCWY